jgi:hypothetical protein
MVMEGAFFLSFLFSNSFFHFLFFGFFSSSDCVDTYSFLFRCDLSDFVAKATSQLVHASVQAQRDRTKEGRAKSGAKYHADPMYGWRILFLSLFDFFLFFFFFRSFII